MNYLTKQIKISKLKSVSIRYFWGWIWIFEYISLAQQVQAESSKEILRGI